MTIIVTHDQAGFGALAALAAAAKLYPESRVLFPDKLAPAAALFWERHGDRLPLKTVSGAEAPPSAGTVVVVNTRRKSRLGSRLPLLERAGAVHIFDHHPASPDDIGGEELFVGEVGATVTLLIEQIRRLSLPLDEVEALLHLLGIYDSTSSLGGAGTTPRDAAAAAFLWEQGIDASLLQEYLHVPPGGSRRGLLETLFRKSKLYDIAGRRLLVTAVPAEEYLQGAPVLLRRLQEIEELDLAVTLVELDGAVSLTARTVADELDLELLLAPLGAAGGRREAAALLEGEALFAVNERLLELLERHLPPPVTVLQIASAPVAAVDEGVTVAAADEYFEERGYCAGPVLSEGRVAGMISRRELHRALRSGLDDAPVRGLMKPAVTAGAEISATALRRIFVEKRAERVVLVNGKNEPVGLVSPVDLLHYAYRLDRRPPAALPRGSLLQSPPPAEMESAAGLIKEALPARWQSLLMLIGQRASLMEAAVYLVGGTVRDLLLGREPARDLDFVVIPDAVSFASGINKYLGGKLKIFERFGTASIFLENGLRLDFATARVELYAAPAALPQVSGSSSLKRDLYRRDFSINTLACSLLPESYGELYDFFGGRQDLHDGVIRTLYHLSFVDDPLRLLRAVRFEQRFGFRIEEKTAELIGKALQSRLLEKVSRSRLAQEVSLIYAEEDPPAVLMRLHELGALGFIYPRLYPDEALWQRLNRIGETLAGARRREWSRRPEEELVYLGGLLMEMAPHDRLAIIRRLGLSRRRAAAVLQGSEAVPPLLRELEEAGREIRPAVLVNRLDPLCPEALLLLDALAASRAVKDNIRLYRESLQYVRPRLRGGTLKQLGLEPGPVYGEIIAELRGAVLDGRVRSEEEELAFVKAYLRGEG
ncbi:MAG: CBS domain-containing protein [Firmicutes bacterium]|nr:CBS domain-containing protein [Bacillota bacterium]